MTPNNQLIQLYKRIISHFNNDIFLIGLILILFVFTLLKINYLTLGCYWDETWPFSYAIFQLHEHWPLILPNTIDPYITRGHPLLFHFLVSTWMKIFGDSLVVAKTFPLLLSVLTLITIYKFGEIFFSKRAGLLAATLLAVQSVFFTQSTLLLLEVQLTLFTLLTFFFYIKKRHSLYILFGSFAILTKETGITVIAAIGMWHLTNYLATIKSSKFKPFFIESLWIIAPVGVAFLYFLLQKILNGWFLFPIHVGFMSFDLKIILDKFEYGLYLTFSFQDKKLISIIAITALAIAVLFRSLTLTNKQWQILHLMFWFLFLFNIFGALNFQSDRYYLPAIAIFLFIASTLVSRIAVKNSIWVIFSFAMIIPSFVYLRYAKGSSDTIDGYKNVVKVHQKTIDYLLQNKLQDKNIYTHFILREAMKATYPGYIEKKQDCFRNFQYEFDPLTTDLYIFSSIEYHLKVDKIRMNNPMKILAQFQEGDAFVIIFQPLYKEILKNKKKEYIEYFKKAIKNDPEWYSRIRKSSLTEKQDIESILIRDAEKYAIQKIIDTIKHISIEKQRQDYLITIKQNAKLLSALVDTAISQQIPIDTVLQQYARKTLK